MSTVESLITKATSRYIAFLAGTFMAYWLVAGWVGWQGDFPLNDDWVYATAIQSWVEQGTFTIHPITSPNLVGQVLWSRVWVDIVNSVDYSILRWTVLLLASLGFVALIDLFRLLGYPVELALIGGVLVFLNPLVFALSFTYMTDVPFLSVTIFALWFWFRFRTHSGYGYYVGFLFAVLWAYLIRQPGLLLCMIPLIDRSVFTRQLRWPLVLIPVGMGVLAHLVFQFWIRRCAGWDYLDWPVLSWYQGQVGPALWRYGYYLVGFLIYGGFLLIPLSVVRWSDEPFRLKMAAIALGLCAGLAGFFWDIPFPFKPNFWHNGGVGPELLRDVYKLHLIHTPRWNRGVEIMLLASSMSSLVLLAGRLCLAIRRVRPLDTVSTNWLVIVVMYIGLIAAMNFFDRYMIWVLPFLLLLLLPRDVHINKAFLLVICSSIFFSVLSTKDYLEWNGAKAKAFHQLQEWGIPSDRMDAGYEYQGLYNYDNPSGKPLDSIGWWVNDPDYVISFGPMPGYHELKVFPFYRYVWMRPDSIRILSREPFVVPTK